jgi:hypothetical protein
MHIHIVANIDYEMFYSPQNIKIGRIRMRDAFSAPDTSLTSYI